MCEVRGIRRLRTRDVESPRVCTQRPVHRVVNISDPGIRWGSRTARLPRKRDTNSEYLKWLLIIEIRISDATHFLRYRDCRSLTYAVAILPRSRRADNQDRPDDAVLRRQVVRGSGDFSNS
jgi:hypothetical protein